MGLRQDFAVYKVHLHNLYTSENLCDFPWKLVGVVSTVGCSALHKNSTQIVMEEPSLQVLVHL